MTSLLLCFNAGAFSIMQDPFLRMHIVSRAWALARDRGASAQAQARDEGLGGRVYDLGDELEGEMSGVVEKACVVGSCMSGEGGGLGAWGDCRGFSEEEEGFIDPETCCCTAGKKRRQIAKDGAHNMHHTEAVKNIRVFRARFGDGLLNADRFPWVPAKASGVVVMYVHNRPEVFNRTLGALRSRTRPGD